MESFTAMSAEGVQAVKSAQVRSGEPYPITTAGPHTEDYATMRTALLDYQDRGSATTAVIAEDLVDELFATDGLVLSQDGFEVLVDALVWRWESHGDDKACNFLSGIAETLDIEFI